MSGASSVAGMNLDVVRMGPPLAVLHPAAQAQQEGCPLGAAVMHELDRITPAGVREEHECVIFLLDQAERQIGADPLVRPGDALPFDDLARSRLEHLHLEAATIRAEA